MTAAVWLVARAELRQRWASLVGVLALTAIVSVGALTALVGAERTHTSIDRFRAQANAADVLFQSSDPALAATMQAALRKLPAVVQVTTRELVNLFPPDPTAPDLALYIDRAGAYGHTVDRPRLLEGRFPATDAPSEVLLSELASEASGYGLGDRIEARTWSPADLVALFEDGDFPGFNGPEVTLTVVGIGRFPAELTGDLRRGDLAALASPVFLAAHPDAGAWPPVVAARLRGGSGDVGAVTAALRAELGEQEAALLTPTTAGEIYLDISQRAVNSLTIGLLLLAFGVALSGSVAVAQAISRQVGESVASPRTLAALGLTSGESAVARALSVAVAGVAGVAVGAAVAVVASPILPVGLARRAEIDPGVQVAPLILAAGAAGLVLFVVTWSFRTAAGRPRRAAGAGGAGRPRGLVARAGAGLTGAPAVAVGLHLAGDRHGGGGGRPLPVRSAVVGLAIGVGGLLASGVIASSLEDLSRDPANWGWAWSSSPDYFGDGDVTELEARLITDERLDAVASLQVDSVVLDGRAVSGFAMETLRGDLSLVRLNGRLPSGAGEVALGRQTMADLEVGIGDSVEATDGGGASRDLVVVGSVVLPPTEGYTLDEGAVLTPEGLLATGHGDHLESVVLRYPSGSSATGVERALSADYGLQFGVFTQPRAPGSIQNLAAGRAVAVWLALFFALLGAAGFLHALVVSARRRSVDLAVLRAIGFRTRQVGASVVTQALVLAGQAVIVGVPVGLVVGRLVWRSLVDDLGARAEPQVPWPIVLAVAPAVAAVAVAAAWWPARSATRVSAARRLRAQ